MINKEITIIDYGMGNIWSVQSALRYLGHDTKISSDPEKILKSHSLLLPGVGSFRKAMYKLQENGLDEAIIESVKSKGVKILGICLGMQLLGSHGTEDGNVKGLGLITNSVDIFKRDEVGTRKIPHIGFDTVKSNTDSILFRGLPLLADFYFVHSYRMKTENLKGTVATCNYGLDFLAAYEENNIFATQFHPEKSQTNGLILLKNFLSE